MKYKLDAEEKEILDAFEKGEFEIIPNTKEEIKKHKQAAKNTLMRLKKESKINIRLYSQDLDIIKKKAMIEGLPYQSLISSVLHKYAHR